jgi:hypothetical protein
MLRVDSKPVYTMASEKSIVPSKLFDDSMDELESPRMRMAKSDIFKDEELAQIEGVCKFVRKGFKNAGCDYE